MKTDELVDMPKWTNFAVLDSMPQSPLSRRILQMAESQTIGMAKKSRELAAQGVDVINLSLGEPDFITPKHIREAAKKAIDDGFTFYPPISGYLELRKAISAKFKRENGLDYAADQIVVSTGAKQSIANVVLSLVDPGDEVIVPMPYWVSYIEIVKLAEGITVPISTTLESNFKMTAAQLEAAITPKSKLLIYSSPCNPTGSVFTQEELSSIADVLRRHPHVYVLSDEIYEHINFLGRHESIAQFDDIRERVIIVNGVSKGYAMTGWRIGYIGASKEIAAACDKMQGQFTSAASSIAQKAAEAALSMDNTPTMEMRDAFHRRRDLVIGLMKDIPGIRLNDPQGAFYVCADIGSYLGKSDGKTILNTANDLCMFLLNTAHVSVVTGEAFGDPNCIRISYAAADDKLTEAIRRIKEALSRLN